MKKICLLLAVLLGKYANAQYFQHLYGSASQHEVNGQMVPVSGPASGYMLIGTHNLPGPISAPPYHNQYLVHTDNNGTPLSNRHYTFSDPAGIAYSSLGHSVAEVNTGLGAFRYAVAGTIIMGAIEQVTLMNTDANGTALYAKRYSFPNYNLRNPRVKTSINNNVVFITGECQKAPPFRGTNEVFILSINFANGNLNWGYTYDVFNQWAQQSLNDRGIDLIENPYAPLIAPELIVVGESGNMGMLLKVNANTGALSTGNAILYSPSTSQRLSCIRRSGNPLVLSNDGFVVGGSMQVGAGIGTPNFDMWTMLINQNGLITWSTTHNTSSGNPVNNFCHDIIERSNTLGNYEYYPVGDWKDPVPNAWPKIQALKLGANGTLVANGEFIYGNPAHTDQGRSIAFSNTGGITISGTKNFPAPNNSFSDQLLINAYFSGHTSCDYNISSFNSVNVNVIPTYLEVIRSDSAEANDMNVDPYTLGDSSICFSLSIPPPASNAREARKPKPGEEMLNFRLKSGAAQTALQTGYMDMELLNTQSNNPEVQICDQLGRPVYCKVQFEPSGDKQGHVRILCTGLQKGLFFITVSDGYSKTSQSVLIH